MRVLQLAIAICVVFLLACSGDSSSSGDNDSGADVGSAEDTVENTTDAPPAPADTTDLPPAPADTTDLPPSPADTTDVTPSPADTTDVTPSPADTTDAAPVDPIELGCAECMEQGKSCYVKGWTEPCMDTDKDSCLSFKDEWSTGTVWCPDVAAATCSDGIKNQNETGLDCGGVCAPCPDCKPDCTGKNCGSDGCGGTCAPGCTGDDVCNSSGSCGPPSNNPTGVASFTWYESYAPCCKDNPNYDPSADTTECDLYSACDYPGLFAAFDGKMSFEWVQTHNVVAFFDADHPTHEEWLELYANKIIRLTKGDIIVDAIIADTCGDADCSGCCTENSQPSGKLVDMEYWTVMSAFGSVSPADGQISYEILEDCASSMPVDGCGVCGGDDTTCVSIAVICAECVEQNKSCYVKGWTDPCMDTDKEFCLSYKGEGSTGTVWCPDVVAGGPDKP